MNRTKGLGRIFRRPRSPYWWIAYVHRGREIRESSRSEKKGLGRHLKTGHTSTGRNRPTGSGASRRGWGLPHAGLRRQGVVGGLCDGNRKVRMRLYVG